MHNALSFQRVHPPKGLTTAIYHPETNMAYCYNPKGPHFAKMGNVLSAQEDPFGNDELRGQRFWLLPEEVLYLLERGSLDVRWPPTGDEDEDGDADANGVGLPMSLQGAYAMFLGDESSHDGALTFERYSVYAGLKRSGYTIHRAPTWDSDSGFPGRECYAKLPSPPRLPWYVGLFNYYTSWWTAWTPEADQDELDTSAEGPLVQSKLYRSYSEIYRRLALINYHDPTTQLAPSDPEFTTDPAFRITYHVWKPGSQTYKKSAPGTPDFRVAVINARETNVPTLEQLSTLLETTPYDPPFETAQLYAKLKYGYKNVILAVVDQGVVSYLRIADAAFGREKLYERKSRPSSGKRGGRRPRGRGK
jgi:tRNA-splicing endonuclease subunit Sen54